MKRTATILALAIAAWVFAKTIGATFDPYLAGTLIAIAVLASISQSLNLPISASRYALLAAFIYALLIPAQLRAPIDGDEPFYLLVTESMVKDHDVDLRNQYRGIRTSDIHRPDLIPQQGDPVGPQGEQYSRHEPFLPLLMIPGYLLFGVPGAIATIAIFGVLLVRSLIRWMEDEGISDATIRTLMPLIVFGPPIVFYAARVWPEVPAAFCFVEAIRGVRQRRAQRWAPALFALVMLKLRFVLIGLMLLPFALRSNRARALAGCALAILALPMLVVWAVSGSATNVHSWTELVPHGPKPYLEALFGLLIDGAAGIAFQAPVYLLGVFAFTRWRSMPEGFRIGAIASLLYVVTLLPRAEWHGGWAPPLRYIVVFMPLLALGAAAFYEQSRAARAWLAPIALWTIGITVHGLAEPWRLFHIASGENAVGEWLSSMFHSDFSRMFPSFMRMNAAAVWGAGVFSAILLGCAIGARREARGAGSVSSAPRLAPRALVPCACAIVLALFFHYGKKSGARVEFEDTHVIHQGGELYPYEYQVGRFFYRGGWLMKTGDSMSFLAKRGQYILYYASTEPSAIELDGHAAHLDAAPTYAMTVIDVPAGGRVTLRCAHGSINLDRMDLRE